MKTSPTGNGSPMDRDIAEWGAFEGESKTKNLFVQKFGSKKIWVNWTLEPAKNTDSSPKISPDGTPKMTKIPRTTRGGFASVSDPATWSTYDEAVAALDQRLNNSFTGIGIVFEKSLNICGVDLDKYWNKDGNLTDDRILDFIIQANTYVEYSPSKTGAHILFQTEEPFEPVVKKHHDEEDQNKVIEIYSSGRYFTFTGDIFGEETEVRLISVADLNKLLSDTLGYPWGAAISESPAEGLDKVVGMIKSAVSTMSDEALLAKMFSSRNGVDVKKLYDGDSSAYGGDASSADMALVSHLCFYAAKDAETIRRIWLASPLGQRPKTQERKDYQNRTIENAIKNCKEVYSPTTTDKALFAEDFDDYGFSLGKGGVPQLVLDNICRVFEKDPRFMGTFRLNSFSTFMECKNERGEWINLLDFYIIKAQRDISVAHPYFAKVSQEMVTAAIKLYSANNAVNPPVDWLRSLEWDGTPRLDSWLYKAYGCPDDELHQSMGANFIKQMVNRIIRKGCQADLVLCLEGGQGTRKSSSLRVLGGDWFAENVSSVDNKDDMIVFAGSILVEFSEGAVLGKASIAKLKSVITTTVDKFRPPYERGLASFPRGCVFALSTNDTAYLKDETGGRRFLIVKLGRIADVEWLDNNRDQLFAEALHRVEVLGEDAYKFSDESAEELLDLQESRTEDGAYDEKVVDWYLGRSGEAQEKGFTILDVFANAINSGGESREISKPMEWQIRSILKRALYLENRVMPRDENGKRSRRWVPSDKTRKKFKVGEDGHKESVDGVDEFASYGMEATQGEASVQAEE